MKSFYYLNPSNQPVGPMDLAAVRQLAEAGIVDGDVLVCEAGEEDWTPLSQLAETSLDSGAPKPPRTAPPPRSGLPPRRLKLPTATASSHRLIGPNTSASNPPDWIPIAAMVTGIVALLALCLPGLSLILAAPALTLGILGHRQAKGSARSFAVTGITCASLALVAALGMLLLWSGAGMTGNPEAVAIEKVLKRDAAIVREAKSRFPNDAAAGTRYVAEQLQRIDTSNCPADFRLAFQQHVNAWRQSIPYVQADTPLNAFLEGLYAGVTEDYGALGMSSYQADLAREQVNATYREVLNSAAVHGARIPES